MANESVTFYKNPKIEILFGFLGGKPIPTKQDKFKPLKAVETDSEGNEIEIKYLYERKEDKNSIQEMKELVNQNAAKAFKERGIIKKPAEVEVILSISLSEKRFKEVDVDNLAKTILDGLIGEAFDDDAQVSSLMVTKFVHQMKVDSILIGITELTETNKGLRNDIMLMRDTEWE